MSNVNKNSTQSMLWTVKHSSSPENHPMINSEKGHDASHRISPAQPLVRCIYCCGCGADVEARLTAGREIYPHRKDLAELPFWKCDTCKNFVGCHHKTTNKTEPLGCIPTPELRAARRHIHAMIDPIWQSGKMGRKELYKKISEVIGWNYHTAKIRTIEEARKVYEHVRQYT